jgi:hypothetical protein
LRIIDEFNEFMKGYELSAVLTKLFMATKSYSDVEKALGEVASKTEFTKIGRALDTYKQVLNDVKNEVTGN